MKKLDSTGYNIFRKRTKFVTCMWFAPLIKTVASVQSIEKSTVKGIIDSQIACTSQLSELEETKNKWAYGHLIKKGKYVILQLDKVIE